MATSDFPSRPGSGLPASRQRSLAPTHSWLILGLVSSWLLALGCNSLAIAAPVRPMPPQPGHRPSPPTPPHPNIEPSDRNEILRVIQSAQPVPPVQSDLWPEPLICTQDQTAFPAFPLCASQPEVDNQNTEPVD